MKRIVYVAFCLPFFFVFIANAAAPKPTPLEVEFFEAMENGQIEASIRTQSSLDSRITIKNKTDVPLDVKLPTAFAGVPILAQTGSTSSLAAAHSRMSGAAMRGPPVGSGGGGGGGGGNTSGGGGQQVGGGMSGGSSSRSSGGSGGGMFSIAPDKTVRQDVKTVCLEHGKKEPNVRMKYKIVPLESVTDKKEVHLLCALVSQGKVDQQSAQAAVWHYNNGMTWDELANKKRKRPPGSPPRMVPYFSRQQMMYAMQLGEKIEEKIAKDLKSEKNESSASRAHPFGTTSQSRPEMYTENVNKILFLQEPERNAAH